MTSTFFGHPFNHNQNSLRNQDFGPIVYIHTRVLEVFDLWTLIAAALSAHVDGKSRAELCFLHFSGTTHHPPAFGSSRSESSLLSSISHFSGSAMLAKDNAPMLVRKRFLKLIKKLCSSLATRTSLKSNPWGENMGCTWSKTTNNLWGKCQAP